MPWVPLFAQNCSKVTTFVKINVVKVNLQSYNLVLKVSPNHLEERPLRGVRDRIGRREKWPKKKLGGGRNRGKK